MAKRLKPQRILRFTGAIAAAGTASQTKVAADGHRRVVGNYHASGGSAPAAGFPRVRQFGDGTNVDRVTVIPQDFTLADTQFPFDVPIEAPYVSVEWTEGPGGTLQAFAWLVPD